VQYAVLSSWQGGWQSSVTVQNTGSTTFSNWALEWTFGGSGVISQLWSGTYTQVGNKVTVKAPSWQPNLAPGASATIGYLGSGTPSAPADFRLNGTPCTTV
jgi:cellulase/cellobiase CelA1